mmetsp:Transcript_13650/g.20821  ORF Transcript_13650/g.20821 Transcript_13650/m.20821 type:complete len:335 (+) Transcript_13650:122-1126(+)
MSRMTNNKRTATTAALDQHDSSKAAACKSDNNKRQQAASLNRSAAHQQASVPVFVQKLHHMLSSPNAEEIQAIVSWNANDDGQTFIVKNCQLFSQRVIPKYFDCTLSSFKRQLNYYGFIRVVDDDVNQLESATKKKGKNKSRAMKYRHERNKFQRNRPEMLYEIRRSTCNDPKIELDYLRDKVNSLEDECTDLKKELKDVKAQMHSWIQVMQQNQDNAVDNPLPLQQRTASATVALKRSKSMGIGCAAVRIMSTESTMGVTAKEKDWELFHDAMFMGSQGSYSNRTISDPGMLDVLLNAGGKLQQMQHDEDELGESDNHGNEDDSSLCEETIPV